ncbi:MAG: MCP four helix bundle domain-containing protein [Kineosporiaceae bacterium]
MRIGVRAKVTAVGLAGATVAVVLGVLGAYQVGQVKDNAVAIYDRGVVPIEDLAVVRRQALQSRLTMANIALTQDDAGKQKYRGDLAQTEKALDTAFDAYLPASVDPELARTTRAEF